MKKKKLEEKIRSAFGSASPDKLDSVLEYCDSAMAENRVATPHTVAPNIPKRRIRWVHAGALALVALCVSAAFMLNGRRASKVETVETESRETVTESIDGENTPGAAATEQSTGIATGGAFCPLPDPEYREMHLAESEATFCLREILGEDKWWQYYGKGEVYSNIWLGDFEGNSAYYVTICVAEHRIDCIVPAKYTEEATNITVTPLVVSNMSEEDFIGEHSAKDKALAAADLDEADVRTLHTSVDKFRADPTYHVSFYLDGYRYYYELDAVTGDILLQNKYYVTPLKDYIEDRYGIVGSSVSILSEALSGTNGTIHSLFASWNADERIYAADYFAVEGEHYREATQFGGYLIAKETTPNYEEDLGVRLINMMDIYAALDYCDILNEVIFSFVCTYDGDNTFDLVARSNSNVYKIGLCDYNVSRRSAGNNIIYYGKARLSEENDMKYFTAESALQIALDHAGVTEYTLESNESIKSGSNKKLSYFYNIVFSSGEYIYKYRVDAVSGEITSCLYGSGKGDVSKVEYNPVNHEGMSKKEVNILLEDAKDEFAKYFDGCTLEEIRFEKDEMMEISGKYKYLFYSGWGHAVEITFTTGDYYDGSLDLEANTQYKMYCLLYNNSLINWEAVGYFFE